MKSFSSRGKMLLACLGMGLAMVGDYLLGFGTVSFSDEPDAYLGLSVNVVPDWRYALSSLLGFACVIFFAIGALELLRVLEVKYQMKQKGGMAYRLFKTANWAGILYFAFIHIGICMLPVIFNAGMEATGDMRASLDMALRVAKSIALPMGLAFLACDGFVTVGWIWMVAKGMLPMKKATLLLNPVFLLLFGQLANVILEGLDSGFESLGWLLLYLTCALGLVRKGEVAGDAV